MTRSDAPKGRGLRVIRVLPWTVAAVRLMAQVVVAPPGPCLGQGPPPEVPGLFAPGIVNQGLPVRDLAISPTGQEIVWTVCFPGGPVVLVGSRETEAGWSEPEVLPFAGDPSRACLEPCFSPDGQSLVFCRDQGTLPDGRKNWDLFVVRREGGGWGTPVPLGPPVNSEANEYFPSLTEAGDLYFTRDDMPRSRAHHLYRARWRAGRYEPPERLPAQVNGRPSQFNGRIARDESCLIWSAVPGSEGVGGTDYCVAFRRPDDTWSEPMVLGPPVSTRGSEEYSASFSPDGRAFFFMSGRIQDSPALLQQPWTLERLRRHARMSGHSQSAIYWMQAGFLEALRNRAVFRASAQP